MRKLLIAVSAALSAATLSLAPASAAPAPKTVRILGEDSFIPDVSLTNTFRFDRKTMTVHTGQSLAWHNTTTDPHTISVVRSEDVPRTIAQVFNCVPCGPFLGGHAPHVGSDGNPVPPFNAFLDDLVVSTAAPKFDSVGDSLVVAPQGGNLPTTTSIIGDTVSAVISAPAGTTLKYICAIHPWMQATIKVVGEQENDNDNNND